MNFLIGLLGDIVAALFKHHVGDEQYSKVKTFFTIISTIVGVIFIGYMVVLYLLFSGYEGKWFIYSLSYLHNIFNN